MSEPWRTKREVATELRVSARWVERNVTPTLRAGGLNRYYMSHVYAQLRGTDETGANVVALRPRRKKEAA